ncbi:MAG: radical SAM family heme chaperone HemW [Lachnospiraceae bacterium]
MKPQVRNLSLYIHIPFCKAKCIYCDFLSFGGCSFSSQKEYVSALCREIKAYTMIAEEYSIKSIFIGGGTPSYIDSSLLEQVMETVYQTFHVDKDAEITIEGNPDSLTKDKLYAYREMGINRLSIGLQSANDTVLKTLGRVHNYDQFIAAFNSARQVGFYNINVDLMSGIPGETAESYIHTLGKIAQLQPEHISAYSLIVEEGTPLSENKELLSLLPSEEEDRKLYARTKLLLKNSGYERYEISNYAKKDFACRHNLVYWRGGEYLGVGLGASSYLTVFLSEDQYEKIRFHGVEDLEEYIGRFAAYDGMQEDHYTSMYHFYENEEDELYDDYGIDIGAGLFDNENSNLVRYRQYEDNPLLEFIRDHYIDLQFLKRKDEMEEFMFLGLRCMKGISKEEFKKRFSVDIESVYGKVIEKYKEQNLLLEQEGHIFLSDKGIDVSNVVMAEFML